MRLSQFKIRNYRSCDLTTLIPNSGLTALIGVNGSGKSNILSAILLLKRATGGSMHRIRPLDNEYVNRSRVSAEIDYDGATIALRGDVFYSTNNRNVDEVVGTRLEIQRDIQLVQEHREEHPSQPGFTENLRG